MYIQLICNADHEIETTTIWGSDISNIDELPTVMMYHRSPVVDPALIYQLPTSPYTAGIHQAVDFKGRRRDVQCARLSDQMVSTSSATMSAKRSRKFVKKLYIVGTLDGIYWTK